MKTDLDVCLPFFGSTDLLLECINHLHLHTEVSYRLIICNDANGPKTTDRVRAWAKEHEKQALILFANKRRRFYTRSANQCAKFASGKWIAFLHPSVMIMDQNWFGKLMQPLRRDARAGVATANIGAPWSNHKPYKVGKQDLPMLRGLCMFRNNMQDRFWPEAHPHDSMFLIQQATLLAKESFWVVPNLRVAQRPFQDARTTLDKLEIGESLEAEVVIER